MLMYSTMFQINEKAQFRCRQRIETCEKCGETVFHESMQVKEKRRRELLNVDFYRNHRDCDGKTCINCERKFSNIQSYNLHLNQCNFEFELEAKVDNEPLVDFNFTKFKKFIAKKNKNWKKIGRELNMKIGMCFNCCRSPCTSPCLPLLCPICNNRYNFYHYIDHYAICYRINGISPFFYFKLCQSSNESNILTSDIIQQLELITISSSSDASEPQCKVPRIRLKSKRIPSSRRIPHDKSQITKSSSNDAEDINLNSTKCTSNCDNPIEQAQINKEHQFFEGTNVADSDYSNPETDQPSSSDFDTKTDRPWAKYKRKSRERNYAHEIKCLIDEIPVEHRSEALLKNNLVSLKAVNSNFLLYSPNEFLKRKFHFLCMEHKWTDPEIGWYGYSFGVRKKYLKDILATETLSAIQHRSSFNQQYRQDRINQILEFILSNSAPAADHSRSIIRKKTSQIQNRFKHDFYRLI